MTATTAPPQPGMKYRKPRMDARGRATTGVRHAVLLAISALMLFPLLLVVSTTLKTPEDVKQNPFGFFSSFSWDNLQTAWTVGEFDSYLWSSILLTVPSTLLVVVCSTLGGYAFARLPFPGRTFCFYVVIVGLLVPFFAYMIPLYYELRSMQLLNSLIGTNLVLASTQLSFGTFFMRAFFADLPTELEQAARIDGASEWQIFRRVMLPLATSGIGALAVYAFLQNWNEFLVPLLYMPAGEHRPLTTGLYLFLGGRTVDIGPLAAGTLITILPVILLFLVLQRQVTQGLVSGAVKG